MTPTDDKGVHTHDFRDIQRRCICGAVSDPEPAVVNVSVSETDWKAYAADQLSGDPMRLLQHLPEWMRAEGAQVLNLHVATSPDMETRAELFNEGFDTAHKQGVGGEFSYGWLLGKLAPILDELPVSQEAKDDVITRIADQILDDSLLHDADSDTRPDQKRGMYGKYFVERLHDPEGKHADDRFFVLDPAHDPYALTALKTYAMVAQDEYPKLADDLREWISELAMEEE